MSVAVLFAEGFEEIEAITIVDVLRRAEIKTYMVGLESLTVTGAHDIRMKMDCLLRDLTESELVMTVLPGGLPGSTNLRDSKEVITHLKGMNHLGKYTAAICAAPIALEKAGLLEGKKATSYPAFEEQLTSADYQQERVVQDGNIITSRGPATALEFSLKLVEVLGKPDAAEALSQGMLLK